MGFRHVTLRQRLFHGIGHAVSDPHHGHWHEYVVEFLFIAANLMFVIGSICFFDHMDDGIVAFGDWMFIGGALINTILTGHILREQVAAKKHLTAQFNDGDRQEVAETILFVVSSAIFTGGAFFFMPGIYKSKEAEHLGHEFGAWGFIIGSMMLVMASYYNALGLAEARAAERREKGEHKKRQLIFRMNCVSLGMTQVASVFFVTGSFLYRPAFLPGKKSETIDTVTNNGTMLYLVGSLIYLGQSLLALVVGIIKHDLDDEELEGEEQGISSARLSVSMRSRRSTAIS